MNKIRIVVAHNNENIKNEIVSSIKGLRYVEIVGTATNGADAYTQIVELGPEMVFADYNFADLPGLDFLRKSKEQMKENIPVFNIIVDQISDEELMEALSITENKINALVRAPYYDRAFEIMQVYQEFITN